MTDAEHPERPEDPEHPEDPGHPRLPEPPRTPDGPQRPQPWDGVRIPLQRSPVEDDGPLPDLRLSPLPGVPRPSARRTARHRTRRFSHTTLRPLLGAWALAVLSPVETSAVEHHLGDCGTCAEEALRLRDAVGLLHPAENLDLAPGLRSRVLAHCLARRTPRVPVPKWAAPYEAETARLDALLQDIGDTEWHAPVRLRWYEGGTQVDRRTTVAGTIAHLLCVDGLVAVALDLADPLGADMPCGLDPTKRTEAYWHAAPVPPTSVVRSPWREQSRRLVRTSSFLAEQGEDRAARAVQVPYGDFALPLPDALLERAFECWIHAGDIADAVAYPYGPPAPAHLHGMIDFAARLLPAALAQRHEGPRGAGRAAAARPVRTVRLEVEGAGGGVWRVPLDRPARAPLPDGDTDEGDDSTTEDVAHLALDGLEFCRLAAGRITPGDAVAGSTGDRTAVTAVLTATASLSRL